MGVGADVVVGDPVQPVAGEWRSGFVGDRGEPDVARVGDEQRGDGYVEPGSLGGGAADVAVLVEERHPRVHLDGEVGDFDLGEQFFDLVAQLGEAVGLVGGVEGCDDDAVDTVALLDAEVSVRRRLLATCRQVRSKMSARRPITLAGSGSSANLAHTSTRCWAHVSGGRSSARGSPQRRLPRR